MLTENAFILINNLDYKEKLRSHAPQWSTVAIDRYGNIVAVIRHKNQPTLELNKKHLLMYPETVQVTVWPGRFNNVHEFENYIAECKEAHKM